MAARVTVALSELPSIDELGLNEPYNVAATAIESLGTLGWATLPGLLPSSAIEAIRTVLETLSFRGPPRPGDSMYTGGPADIGAVSTSVPRLHKHESLALQHPLFLEVSTSPRIGGAGAQLLGGECLFAQDVSFFKPPGADRTPYHQDLAFYPFDRKGSVSVWIALLEITPEMGHMEYVEGSHLAGPLGRYFGDGIMADYPELGPLRVGGPEHLAAGDAVVHHDLTVHGAASNRSDRMREAYTTRFMRPDTLYTGTRHPHFDRFDLQPNSCFGDSTMFPRLTSR